MLTTPLAYDYECTTLCTRVHLSFLYWRSAVADPFITDSTRIRLFDSATVSVLVRAACSLPPFARAVTSPYDVGHSDRMPTRMCPPQLYLSRAHELFLNICGATVNLTTHVTRFRFDSGTRLFHWIQRSRNLSLTVANILALPARPSSTATIDSPPELQIPDSRHVLNVSGKSSSRASHG